MEITHRLEVNLVVEHGPSPEEVRGSVQAALAWALANRFKSVGAMVQSVLVVK